MKAHETAQKELRSAQKRALFSIFVNASLAGAKGIAGFAAGSASLIGDALHSATDVLASGAAFVGLWLAGRRHPSFPYGLYKAETVATLIISIVVILAAYEIGRWAIVGTPGAPNTTLALTVAVASLIITVSFGLYQLAQGRKLGSTALVADARDYLVDGASTLVVIASLIGESFGYHLERYAAGAVSLFVFWAGGTLLFRTLKDLMDAGMDPEEQEKISSYLKAHPQVRSVEDCMGRTAGGRYIINLDVILHTTSHEVADRVADRLEEELYAEFPRVVMAHIRTHHGHSVTIRRFVPAQDESGKSSEHFASAPYFRVETVDAGTGNVLHFEVLPNPHSDAEKTKGLLVGKWLLELDPDEVCIGSAGVNKTAGYLLREAGVRLLEMDGTLCADVAHLHSSNETPAS
ncbi:cation diffusion facilitator family transporter [Desulfobaculum bizertense DSM 18034]|uniref:Cation diffusion facilitator family transporter n=1 Tax=Desulfobaculum bizertense DSM 18034 TaxID=1121442 RepID=A0A1T4VKF8_9BACT|nr:cation diffusion facilitator family transporter [Desulfobaculum bizertense DSM 18034]